MHRPPLLRGVLFLLFLNLNACTFPAALPPQHTPPEKAEESLAPPSLPQGESSVPGTGILSLEREEREVLPHVTRIKAETSLRQNIPSGEPSSPRTPAEKHGGPLLSSEEGQELAGPPRVFSLSELSDTPRQEIILPLQDIYALSPHAHLLRPRQARPQPRPRPVARPSGGPVDWQSIINEAGEIFGLDPALLSAVIRTESAFNHVAESRSGAQGAMQVMPDTQEELGLLDPFDPRANVYAGAQYLMHLLHSFPSVELALAAYNAGPGAVKKYGGIPPFTETRIYVRQVLQYWQEEKNKIQKK